MEDKELEPCYFENITQKAKVVLNDKSYLNPKSERWRFTPIREYYGIDFTIETAPVPDSEKIQSYRIDNTILVVILNGKLNTHLSDSIPEEVKIENLKEIISNFPEKFSNTLYGNSNCEENYFLFGLQTPGGLQPT